MGGDVFADDRMVLDEINAGLWGGLVCFRHSVVPFDERSMGEESRDGKALARPAFLYSRFPDHMIAIGAVECIKGVVSRLARSLAARERPGMRTWRPGSFWNPEGQRSIGG
jgi:hypothetical protein